MFGSKCNISSDHQTKKSNIIYVLLEEMRYLKAKMLNPNYNLNSAWFEMKCIVRTSYTVQVKLFQCFSYC